jgi:tRNA C32,U32 (ribose-2'-O)-methylase TrmJ
LIKIKKTKKGSGKIPPKSKTQEPKAEPTLSSKEIIDIEKAKQKTMSKLVAVEKAKQKTMDKVLQLLKAGFTKQEINKLLNIN